MRTLRGGRTDGRTERQTGREAGTGTGRQTSREIVNGIDPLTLTHRLDSLTILQCPTNRQTQPNPVRCSLYHAAAASVLRSLGHRAAAPLAAVSRRFIHFSHVCAIHSFIHFQRRRSLWDRGDTSPPNIWTGGHYHECPPQYF